MKKGMGYLKGKRKKKKQKIDVIKDKTGGR